MVGSDASVLTKLYFVLSCFQLTQNTQKKYFVVGSANCRDWNALWLFACTFLNISYKKNRALYFFLVLKGPDAAPFAVCQFNSHYHLEEEEPLWFYDLAYFVIVYILKFSSSPILVECGGWHKFYGYDIPIGCPHEQRGSQVIFVLLYSCVKGVPIPWGVLLVDRCYMNTYLNFEHPKNNNVWKEELKKISDVFLRMITIKGSFHLQVCNYIINYTIIPQKNTALGGIT